MAHYSSASFGDTTARRRDERVHAAAGKDDRTILLKAIERCRVSRGWRPSQNRPFEGAGALHDCHVVQILFRDTHTTTHHAMLDFDNNVEIRGKSLLDVELNDAWV